MKVKANWPVNTGKKVQDAGSTFDVSEELAEELEKLGAVEVLGRKKADEKTDDGSKKAEEKADDGGKKGADGGGNDDPTPPAA
ncbi:hypothetical protein [Cupriavidus basilensis]|uniref:hypothetical protein n=1 Tax=Cupriavidus basilensis TaxID=68895 RepID=UPI00284618FF|nr:hypothetical protein [Cupriavidus basilensis]MDR3382307.1 hypothetical protein [Cupriavidus basilensis]